MDFTNIEAAFPSPFLPTFLVGIPSRVWTASFFLTVQLALGSVFFACLWGIPSGWAAYRCGYKAADRANAFAKRSSWLWCYWIGMGAALSLPLIMHAAAWESMAGKFGWWTWTQSGARIQGRFTGLLASVWIHGVHGSAIVSLATWYGLRSVPNQLLRAASLEATPMSVLARVQWPMAGPWIIVGCLAVAALACSEMVVADLYGLRTIADEFYLFHATNPTPWAIVWVCAFPGMLGVTLAWLVRRSMRRPTTPLAASTMGAIQNDALGISDSKRIFLQAGCRVVLVVHLVLLLVVPLASLVLKAGHQVRIQDGIRTIHWNLMEFWDNLWIIPIQFASDYGWTLLIAVMAGGTSLFIAACCTLGTSAEGRRFRGLDGLMVVIFLVPGPVVGLLVVSLFQLPVPGFGWLYQGSLIPTWLAVLPRSVPVAYWCMRVSARAVPKSSQFAGRLDASWGARVWSILFPLTTPGLAFACAALIASGDVPVMLPVLPPGASTAGTRLFALLHSGSRYQEAGLALWYVFFCLVLVAPFAIRWRKPW